MSIYLNVFPIVKYPEQILLVSLPYTDDNYEQYKGSCYRIGNVLYIYGRRLDHGKAVVLSKGEKEFSLILRHLLLKAISNNIDKHKYSVVDETKQKRLILIRAQPSLKFDELYVYEGIELGTLHWKHREHINFGLIVDYFTKNQWDERFIKSRFKSISKPPPASYANIRKYLGSKSYEIFQKIYELRGEKKKGCWRQDALNQRMLKIEELLKECLNWRDSIEKQLPLPTGEEIILSSKKVNVEINFTTR
jgi:hypothetical protein